MLAFPVVIRRVIGLGVAGCHFVEGIECADPFAGGEILHLDAAVRHVGQVLGEALSAGPEAREVARPGGDHDHLDALLRDGGRRERGCGGRAGRRLHRPW